MEFSPITGIIILLLELSVIPVIMQKYPKLSIFQSMLTAFLMDWLMLILAGIYPIGVVLTTRKCR